MSQVLHPHTLGPHLGDGGALIGGQVTARTRGCEREGEEVVGVKNTTAISRQQTSSLFLLAALRQQVTSYSRLATDGLRLIAST